MYNKTIKLLFTICAIFYHGYTFANDCTTVFDNGEGKYSGGCKDGLADGRGEYIWNNGAKYIGEFNNGMRNGQGVMHYKNGNLFRGIFENDKISSDPGYFTWASTGYSQLGYFSGSEWNPLGDAVDCKVTDCNIKNNNKMPTTSTNKEGASQNNSNECRDLITLVSKKHRSWLSPFGGNDSLGMSRYKDLEQRWDKAWASPNQAFEFDDGPYYGRKTFMVSLKGDCKSFTLRVSGSNTTNRFVNSAFIQGQFFLENVRKTDKGYFGVITGIKTYNGCNWAGMCNSHGINITCYGKDCQYESLESLFDRGLVNSSDSWPTTMREKILEMEKKADLQQKKIAEEKRLADEAAAKNLRAYQARIDKENAEFNAILSAKNARDMYLGAVNYEDLGERGRAKTIYRSLIKRFPSSNEALLGSQRLTKLSDVEAIETSNRDAAYRVDESIRKQCESERQACFSRCGGIKNYSARTDCQVGCPLCN